MKPSTNVFAAGAGLLALVSVVACVRSAAVVTAPMTDADASASEIALGRAPFVPPSEVVLPFRPGDRWVGSYTCRQGPTDMTIVFEEIGFLPGPEAHDSDSVDVTAIFEFHFDGKGRAGYPASDGSARMRGTYDVKTRRLRLVGSEWIERSERSERREHLLEQPPNHGLINFVGVVNPRASARASGTYTGTVEGSACTTFSAHPEVDVETPEKPGARPVLPRSLPRPGP